jgi:hypothetical protein
VVVGTAVVCVEPVVGGVVGVAVGDFVSTDEKDGCQVGISVLLGKKIGFLDRNCNGVLVGKLV